MDIPTGIDFRWNFWLANHPTPRQEVASMDISLHETAVAQETVYEARTHRRNREKP